MVGDLMTTKVKDSRGNLRITGASPLDAWPIDSVYISMSSANPATIFGGTWVQFAQGRMLIGQTGSDTDFDVAGETGGEKTHVLTPAEMPAHQHDIGHNHTAFDTGSAGAHTHGLNVSTATGSAGNAVRGTSTVAATVANAVASDGAHVHNVNVPPFVGNSSNIGGGGAHNNMPPYIVTYMWRRTG